MKNFIRIVMGVTSLFLLGLLYAMTVTTGEIRTLGDVDYFNRGVFFDLTAAIGLVFIIYFFFFAAVLNENSIRPIILLVFAFIAVICVPAITYESQKSVSPLASSSSNKEEVLASDAKVFFAEISNMDPNNSYWDNVTNDEKLEAYEVLKKGDDLPLSENKRKELTLLGENPDDFETKTLKSELVEAPGLGWLQRVDSFICIFENPDGEIPAKECFGPDSPRPNRFIVTVHERPSEFLRTGLFILANLLLIAVVYPPRFLRNNKKLKES